MHDTASSCAWRNFRRPRLGHFEHQGRINFTELLGYGLDGIVWKINVDDCAYALKVFWDNHPPKDTRYWAVQRECQNASLLEKMRFAIENSSESIWLHPQPKTFRDALLSLHAFSDEGRSRQLYRNTPGAIQYNTAPHLRKCYGWIMISGKELCALPSKVRTLEAQVDGVVREISPKEDYHAIAYEYVPNIRCTLSTEIMQAQLDFFGSPGSAWYRCEWRIGKVPESWWIWRILYALGMPHGFQVFTDKDMQERWHRNHKFTIHCRLT
ncbi:hypothetical protein BDY21DRAFT_214789 [Lineolata rhizophorae]|uniref:Protein kinase domain-containing protein n=1 Tax=Lineolata rhizophorae TaxID=578093 RepID=A0A6A6P2C7_9PEZI|nr:hypothetical protein BDY21DRAFT_214789 [Lineolata rhizophorae]